MSIELFFVFCLAICIALWIGVILEMDNAIKRLEKRLSRIELDLIKLEIRKPYDPRR